MSSNCWWPRSAKFSYRCRRFICIHLPGAPVESRGDDDGGEVTADGTAASWHVEAEAAAAAAAGESRY